MTQKKKREASRWEWPELNQTQKVVYTWIIFTIIFSIAMYWITWNGSQPIPDTEINGTEVSLSICEDSANEFTLSNTDQTTKMFVESDDYFILDNHEDVLINGHISEGGSYYEASGVAVTDATWEVAKSSSCVHFRFTSQERPLTVTQVNWQPSVGLNLVLITLFNMIVSMIVFLISGLVFRPYWVY